MLYSANDSEKYNYNLTLANSVIFTEMNTIDQIYTSDSLTLTKIP